MTTKQKFFSQHFQDVILYRNLINQKCNGIFVEIGANNGITYSNTKFFEDVLGFTGMLIEPHPIAFDELIKNRPNCKCLNYAISKTEGSMDFGIPDNSTMMAGLIDENLKKRKNLEIIKVKSVPFYKILNTDIYKYIDIFFIDVEGGEFEVLETIDWNIKIYIIYIELDNTNKEKDEKCRELLKSKGFIEELNDPINSIWINKNNKRENIFIDNKESIFQKPIITERGCENNDGVHIQKHEGFINMMHYYISEYEKKKN